jgi:hypothetical protein
MEISKGDSASAFVMMGDTETHMLSVTRQYLQARKTNPWDRGSFLLGYAPATDRPLILAR